MIELIEEHSFLTDTLGPGSNVLDVGCRGFAIPRELARRGCRVIAMDPDPVIQPPEIENVSFVRKALVARGKPRVMQYASFDNGVGNFIVGGAARIPPRSQVMQVECWNIEEASAHFGVFVWDAVKLDCEGAEYEMLLDWPGPIAKQICVEFHEHTGYNSEGLDYFPRMLQHLQQWYDVAKHDLTRQHGLGFNHWDSVFVLRAS